MTDIVEKRHALLERMAEQYDGRGAPAVTRSIPRRDPDLPVPLSFSQERLWFLDKLAPGSPFYVESGMLRLPIPMDPKALQRAIQYVAMRHEVLRAYMYEEDGGPLQAAMAAFEAALPVTDLSFLPAAERQKEIERIAIEHATLPFDLARGPLFRARLLRLGFADHVFLMAFHHIVTDGWSSSIFNREISQAYQAFISGRMVHLPEPPVQYFDYAVWQRQEAQSESFARQLAYWREQLRDLPQLELPLDRPRPRALQFRGTHLPVKVPPNLSAGLGAIGKREGVTLFMSALAVFAALLYRHTGQTDLVIGMPIAGRNRPELEPLIGLFVNVLVLRLDVSGDPSYRELLRRVKRTTMNALDHQDTPFDALVGEFQPQRDLGRNPLFQVMFQVFTPPNEKAGAPQESDAANIDRGTAIVDLAWHLLDTPAGIQGRIEYSTELFDGATIERQFRHFLRLAADAIAHPDRPLSQLEMLSTEERVQVLTSWQGEARSYPDETIPSLFAARAAKSPDAVALLSGDERVTFGELAQRVSRLARYLYARGIRAGDRVGICLERSPEMIAAALAVMQAGAAFVPLDPAYPEARLRYILEHSGARMLVTTTSLVFGNATAICLDTDPLETSAEAAVAPIFPNDAAHVIYTSGSTGKPKGIVGLHGATLNRFHWMWEAFPFEANEVASQKTAISFADSVWETFGPLLAGVPLAIVPEETVREIRALVALLAAREVTRFLAVPSLLEALFDSDLDLERELPRLRWWFVSGEALPDALARRFRERLPHATLVNLYGSSEVSADVTCAVIDDGEVTIGRPIANCRAYVLDRSLHLVPPGIAGDLYVAGANLTRGYLHSPGMTAERFLPDPFSTRPGTRMYATGDRARQLPDGRLVYLSRTDHQIKLRGHRIELGEVETALRDHPRVRQAVACVQDDGAGGRLVAWMVVNGGLDDGEVRAFLASRLPAAMVPGVFVVLDELPLTPSGKVDRLALASRTAISRSTRQFTPPQTEAELALAGIWSDLLRRDSISVNESFFEIGGHSLLAIRLVSRIRSDIGLELPLREVFLHPTLAGQALAVEQALLDELDALSDEEARERLVTEGEPHVH